MKYLNRFFAEAFILLALVISTNAQNSVLTEGNWYKIAVEQTGISQITYDDLQNYGLDPAQINPKHLRIYGNGNGMLPEKNDAFRYDDLQEASIFVYGEEDESFDPGDFILFYGESPTEWNFNEETGWFESELNLYSDFTCYFLTADLGEGKRITDMDEITEEPTNVVTTYNSYTAHQLELENLIRSGKVWYGEKFGETMAYTFDFNFPGLFTTAPIHLKSEFAARSFVNSQMDVMLDGNPLSSVSITAVNPTSTKFAQKKSDSVSFFLNDPEFTLGFTYDLPTDSSTAWLDYFELNYSKELQLSENQINFRSISSVGTGNITLFLVDQADASTWVWNVSDPLNIVGMPGIILSSQYEFKAETDSLLEFVAFKGMEFPSPEFIGTVENQNLHGTGPVDFVIISPAEFMDAATQLGGFHETQDGFSWMAVTPQQVYNEFSSGAQDVTAIRDYMRFMYTHSNEQQPQYLLLFGDGSYDPKDRIPNNSNYIPTFQTRESLISTSSMVVDDYFGLLDEDEGYDAIGLLDIGIGRLPVTSAAEANDAVSKIIYYATNTNTFGSWKNDICIAADDGDGNLHLEQAESLATFLTGYNTSKLYFDFYELIQTPEGPRYPDAKTALNQKVNDGTFYINYTGHGFPDGWAEERVLELEDIQSWNNINKLPVIVSACCSFGLFDDPANQSGGELAVLKNDGGAVGVFSNTRLAYAAASSYLNQRLVQYLANPEIPTKRLGDMLRESKPPWQMTTRNFALLGDPALKISIPEYHVLTETVNGINLNQPIDTIHPGEEIIISGKIIDFEGNLVNNYSGELYIKIYERPYIKTTLGNQANSYPVDIVLQDSVLMEIQADVINGEFEFFFNLPYDMGQEFGKLKISYYAQNNVTDAHGYFSEVVVGGEPNVVNEIKQNNEFSLFPTFATTQLNLINHVNSAYFQVNITNLSGKTVFSEQFKNVENKNRLRLNINHLPSGFYMLNIKSDQGISDFKFIKK